jgi:hypothetical protein
MNKFEDQNKCIFDFEDFKHLWDLKPDPIGGFQSMTIQFVNLIDCIFSDNILKRLCKSYLRYSQAINIRLVTA